MDTRNDATRGRFTRRRRADSLKFTCILCGGEQSQAQGLKLNPSLPVAYHFRQVMAPVLMSGSIAEELARLFDSPAAWICQADAERLGHALGSKHPGLVQTARGEIQVFVSLAEYGDRRGRLIAPMRSLVGSIMSGDPLESGNTRQEGVTTLYECVANRSSPQACLCGGWHSALRSRVLLLPNLKVGYHIFGEDCARAIEEACNIKMTLSLAKHQVTKDGGHKKSRPRLLVA